MTDSVTLRSHLAGSLNDIVESASLGALGKCSMVCDLVSLFVDYQEEGAELFLDAYLTDDLGKLTALIPQSARLCLGHLDCDDVGVGKAVKTAAPLARGPWKMYLAANASTLEFGLFRDSAHPLNVPLDLTLGTGDVGDAKFIRVTRLARDSVRVSAHNGKAVIVHFTNEIGGVQNANESIAELCNIICSNLEEKRAQPCRTYLVSLVSRALRESHGSLIAIASGAKVPKFLGDCSTFDPAIDLDEAVELVRRDATMIPQLLALESLVLGMFCSDGIVVINTRARVLAYNAFVKLKASNVSGGARRRV